MPARDRLKELQDNYEEQDETEKRKEKKMDKEIKHYLRECDLVRENLKKIDENVSKINKFLKESRCYKFEDLQNGVKPISRETDKIIQNISRKLKELHIAKEDVERVTTANTKMKFMQFTSLREGFTTSLNSYIDAMKIYETNLEKFKCSIQKTVQGDDYDENQPLTGDQDQLFIGNYLVEKREAEQQLKDVEERHQLLLQIESQLTEVKDLFIQIAILVDQQQESINRAEYHAAITTHAVEMAHNDLEKAKKKQKSASKIKIFLIVTAIIIIIILLILLIK